MFQSRAFKEEASNEILEAATRHMYLTEEMMIEKLKTNPLFSAQVSQLKLFPLFDHPGFVAPQSAQQQEALVNGQANRGDQITGQIPGTDIEGGQNER